MADSSEKTKDLDTERDDLQDEAGHLDDDTQQRPDKYNPNKRRRSIRRRVYERFYQMRDDPLRKEAEADWETADLAYGMVTPDIDADDWRANFKLPDAFSAIQTQAQETIERRSRPTLKKTEESDEPVQDLGNAVLTYNMDSTGYDYQVTLAKLSASIRGTSFTMDYWRTEKRTVKDPETVDPETGEITYKSRVITDFDDDYTEWVANEFIYIDERGDHVDRAADMFRREILNVDIFRDKYGKKPGFFDTEWVQAGGDTSTRSVFRLPQDITEQDVEILHYYNRDIDAYWVVANNVTIYDDPLPTKHKELPIGVWYQYRQPGRFWGIGIPKIVHMLMEERRSIRMLNLDRQKIIVGGAFLHNNAFDIDEEDEVVYPGKWISVDTNGQPIGNALQQLQMSDVPASYFRTEEVLLEDERRATGIDDRISVSNSATTATQAAIVKESTLKRINLISITNEMDTVLRLGRIKWSNILLFYGDARIDKITKDNEEREQKVYRKISVNGKKFSIVDKEGKKTLTMDDVRGGSALTLKPEMAKYLEGSWDITVDADAYTPPSKAIEQTKKTETFSLLMANPATLAILDVQGATADLLKVNNIDPDKWLKNKDGSKKDMMMLADSENMIMAHGQPLDGTPNATEDHTLVHLMYVKTQEYQDLPPEFKQIIMDHIMQEHDNNPATGQSAALMDQYGLTPKPGLIPPGLPGGFPPGAGGALPPPGIQANTTEPQAQVADLQPTNFSAPA
jgi:hypothetical protein